MSFETLQHYTHVALTDQEDTHMWETGQDSLLGIVDTPRRHSYVGDMSELVVGRR
jgi:hypothetical protein